MKHKIVFYFPWGEVSGGPIYLCNLAKMLSRLDEYEVYYTDYENGLSDELLQGAKVEKITVSSDNYQIGFKDEPLTIITPIYFANWLPELHQDSKILFVNWHICCIDVLREEMKIASNDMEIVLRRIAENDAQFFLDRSHLLGAEFKGVKSSDNFVPVFLEPIKTSNDLKIGSNSLKDIAILGRLVLDKVFSVINVLDKLNDLGKLGLRVHIIGDGPEKHRIDQQRYKNLEIIFTGTISTSELAKYLMKNVDALFGMGTAALEGARLKIPTVLLPNDTKKISCDKFVFLHKSSGFCLGWHESQIDKLRVKPQKMTEIIEAIYLPENRKEIACRDYEYFQHNHSYNDTKDAIVEAISRTELKAGQFKNLLSSMKHFHKLVVRKNVDLLSVERVSEETYYVYPFNSVLKFKLRKRLLEDYWTLILFGLPMLKIIRVNSRLRVRLFFPNLKSAMQNFLGINIILERLHNQSIKYEHFINEIEDITLIRSMDIIDIGASFGDSALVLSKYTSKRVHSIEPSKDNYSLLLQVIEDNSLDNVVPHHIGISCENGTSVVRNFEDYSFIDLEYKPSKDENKLETVQTKTIDEFVSENKITPGLIKMDVEGLEPQVLRGSVNTIKAFKPIFILSAYHCYDDLFGLKDFLENMGVGYKFKYRKPSDLSILNDLTLIAY